MRNFWTYFLCLICFGFIFSQKVEIKWQNPQSISRYENDTGIYPYFLGNYSLINNVPIFSDQINDINDDKQLGNFQWIKITNKDLYSITSENIPTKEVWNCKISKGFLYYDIIPFKKENGEFYMLQSFEIIPKQNLIQPMNAKILDFSESVLKSGNYYKIRISQTGVYKLDYTFLKSKGIDIDAINPKNIKIYGNGGSMLSEKIDDFRYNDLQENAILILGEEDNKFDANDYILFYAKGADSWKQTNNIVYHQKNIYDDYAYYYLKIDGNQGKRISEITFGNPNTFFSTYNEMLFFEEELESLNQVGRIWVGKNLNQPQNINFSVSNVNLNQPILTRLNIASNNGQNTIVSVKLNGNQIINSAILNNNFGVLTQSETNSNILESKLNYEIILDNSSNPSGKVHLNYLESIFENNLIYNQKQLSFRKIQNLEDGQIHGFRLQNVPQNIRVWNVSDLTNVNSLRNLGFVPNYEFSYRSTNTNFKNEFIAFTDETALIPEWIGRISNQNIRGFKDVNYFVISHPDFISQANRLANYHKSKGLNVEIIPINQIYNEFSSGSQDITAIRDFLRFHYQKDNHKLKYVLFFGDASYDYKNRIRNNTNFVPSYQSFISSDLDNSFVTDDYFTILDDGESNLDSNGLSQINSFEMDIAVGRLPITNISNAKLLVDKILSYVNQNNSKGTPFGDWKTKLHLVVDDDGIPSNNPTSTFHERMENSLNPLITTQLPAYTLRKLYADSFQQQVSGGGQRFPQVNEAIKNAIESGSLLINYFGHGGPTGWAQERILTLEDINNNTNFNTEFSRFPLILTITCDFSIWDNPNLESGGEILLFNPNGGSFSNITTSRAIGVQYGLNVNRIFMEELLKFEQTNFATIGEAVLRAKIRYNSYDNRKVNLLGDPAISLTHPPRNILITEINGIPANSFTGTIRALDFVTIKGQVLNENNQLDSSFKGELSAILFDKEVLKKTLNNDGNLPILTYPEQINTVFKGNTKVETGIFNLEFYVPKDINYQVGNSKLVLYADNKKIDALTHKNDILLGGINPDGINDNTPPIIKLYLNNTNFVDGGISNKNPILLACLTDDFGINTTGTGVGHDITAVLDGNILGTYVLNEFYTGGKSSICGDNNLKDFQQGRVVFPLQNLTLGPHQIVFKVWDINNNSSTATLNFIVVEEGSDKLIIKNLLNWPNPFTDKTFFHFEHNCNTPLDVMVQVFTITGKLIKTIHQTVSSSPIREGYRTNKYDISWDGLDDFGDKIGRGTYIYKINVESTSDSNCKGSASAIEKLVIIK